LDQDYKIEHTFDHAAKFGGDQPTDCGDLVAKIEKLRIWGKAQRESARRPKSDWGTI